MKTICVYADTNTYDLLEIVLEEYKLVSTVTDAVEIGIVCVSHNSLDIDLSILRHLSRRCPVIALVCTGGNSAEIFYAGALAILRKPVDDNYLKSQIGALERFCK